MALPGPAPFSMAPPQTSTPAAAPHSSEDPSKRIRKPYTISKSRESWTDAEHDKFFEALHLFDRDWKKIEAFVGSKTVIQIRSHAQKYFLKVQRNGTNEHVPPPRPKRKAAHPYPQKAPKNAQLPSQVRGSVQSSSARHGTGHVLRAHTSSIPRRPVVSAAASALTEKSAPKISSLHVLKDDLKSTEPIVTNNYCSSTESTPGTQTGGVAGRGNQGHSLRVLPDFSQVYSFIGGVFDPNVTDHLQKLKQMDPIDVETSVLLMRNLSINLTSPAFEDHRRLISSSYEIDSKDSSQWRM